MLTDTPDKAVSEKVLLQLICKVISVCQGIVVQFVIYFYYLMLYYQTVWTCEGLVCYIIMIACRVY